MKERTHANLPGGVTTADRPSSVEEIDLERIVWDSEYRRAVKPLFDPAKTPKRDPAVAVAVAPTEARVPAKFGIVADPD